MTYEEKEEVYNSVSNYWFAGDKQFDGSVNECLNLIEERHGKEAILHATSYMLDLGFDLGPNVVDYM